MTPVIQRLEMLVRMRGQERDRHERLVQDARRTYDACCAKMQAGQDEAARIEERYEAACHARIKAPSDMLVADYFHQQFAALQIARAELAQVSEQVTNAATLLAEAKQAHRRAQLRLDVLEEELARERRDERRRIARRLDAARPDALPQRAVVA